MDISNGVKKLIEDNPILSSIALTIAIWYGSYYLGNRVGECFGNIMNNYF